MERYETAQDYLYDLKQLTKLQLRLYREYIRKKDQALTAQEKVFSKKKLDHLLYEETDQELLKAFEQEAQGLRMEWKHMEEIASNSIKQGIFIPLSYLFRIYQLEEFEQFCVKIALARELDPSFEEIYSLLQESGSSDLKIPFCIQLYTYDERKQEKIMEQLFEREEFYQHFFKWDKKWNFSIDFRLKLSKRILQFLYNPEKADTKLTNLVQIFLPNTKEKLFVQEQFSEQIQKWIVQKGNSQIFYLWGEEGSGKRTQIKELCNKNKKILLLVNLNQVSSEDQKLICALKREKKIRNAVLAFFHFEKFCKAEKEGSVYKFLMEFVKKGESLILLSTEPWNYPKDVLIVPIREKKMESLTRKERELLWQKWLEQEEIEETISFQKLANQFEFTAGKIKQAIWESKETCIWKKKEKISEDSLYDACQKQIKISLEEKATLVQGNYSFEDLVLEERQKQLLKDALAQVIHYQQVYENWGFSKKITYGRGVSMLFCGPPGTGKTMGALVLAKELRLPLYKADLSGIMSKYIGETEKNLSIIFDEVKKGKSILFFDEADALFGKRQEVKDAQDKYANAETSYLLQKMEEYEGIVILATNYLINFDEAFKRRIKFIIEFPFPDQEKRKQIWKKVFPKEIPFGEEMDYEYLAQQFTLSGSNIKNIAVAAAFLAASKGEKVCMHHILYALKQEMSKSGRTMETKEFGEYYYLMKE